MNDFGALMEKLFAPGRMYTLTGAGGKSTGMRAVAAALSRKGIRARMTTTTRVGVEEFAGVPVVLAETADQADAALASTRPILLMVSSEMPGQGKYKGLEPSVLDAVRVGSDAVLVIEGDGSRRRPLKVPTEREPVVPAASAAVVALMGASGFGEPVDEDHCYNHEAAFDILPAGARVFDAAALAALAVHPAGCRKGVTAEMELHVFLNQGDLLHKRSIAVQVFRMLAEVPRMRVSLLSLQQEVVYETNEL